MKPISTFCVIPDLPDELAPLWDLGHNLWWSWCQEAVLIFHRMDPKAWIDSGRNPLRFLSTLSPEQLAELSSEPELAGRIKGVVSHFEEYRQRQSWFEQSYPDSAMSIAYFSLEFGLVESLPIFSGGLGVLAGDHLKSASDLGLPLVGVGLLYRPLLRLALLLLFLQMPGTALPLVLLPEICFTDFPHALTLEGQYIIKNLILISAALVIGGTVRHQPAKERFL